jgi:hypothetical protein
MDGAHLISKKDIKKSKNNVGQFPSTLCTSKTNYNLVKLLQFHEGARSLANKHNC